MPPTPHKPEKVTKTSTVTLKAEGPAHNIIVLVSGTTDPINATNKTPSHSYRSAKVKPQSSDPNWYWQYEYDGKKSTLFDDLKKIESDLKAYNVAVFSAHGWSGYNAVPTREVTGGYLVDRLCGSNGEQAYYEAYLKKPVHFHLVGHSHGGNVINEMTKRMAKCKEWPASWSVKTIVYLSTPFFQKIHQIDPTALHPGCDIINVFNKYDLTQRVVANFSLHHLTGVMDVTGTAMDDIVADLNKIMGYKPDPKKPEDAGKPEIKGFNMDVVSAALFPPRLYDFDDRPWHADWTLAMETKRGEAMYKECLALFKNVDALLSAIEAVVKSLNAELEFKLDKALEGKIKNRRKVVSDPLLARFKKSIGAIKIGLAPTIKAFEKRIPTKRFPYYGLVADLYLDQFLRPLIDFLAVNAPGADGKLPSPPAPKDSLLDLLHDLLHDQVDVFDDTKNTPAAQLAKTPFKDRLFHVNVSPADKYYNQREGPFANFMRHLEVVEARYFASPGKADLLDLLLTLVAQVEAVHGITDTIDSWINMLSAGDWVEIVAKLGDDAFEQIIKDLLATCRNYRTILEQRNFNGIVVTTDKADDKKGVLKRGDLNYLMRVSHSVSREALDPRVKELLVAQIKA